MVSRRAARTYYVTSYNCMDMCMCIQRSLLTLKHLGVYMAEWLRRIALELLARLRCGSGSNPMRVNCQLLTEDCWFTPRNRLSLQLWKLTSIYNQIRLKNGVKHPFTSRIGELFFILYCTTILTSCKEKS